MHLTQTEAERLNPPIQSVRYDERSQKYFIEIIDHPDWLEVGYIPKPRTRWGWFLYHLVHGLAMRYPVRKVLLFSVVNAFFGEDEGQ